MRFANRTEAGRLLARALEERELARPIVLALPRGGVEVAAEVARALGAPLDVFVVRKIGAPMQPELGVGAVAETGERILNEALVRELGLDDAILAELTRGELAEARRRVRRYRGDRPVPDLTGCTVVLVDDGIATGGTVEAALVALRQLEPARIVLAVPVAAPDSLERLRPLADEVVCLLAPEELYAIGAWYDDFRQLSDDDVLRLLHDHPATRNDGSPATREREIILPAGVSLEGDLIVPENAIGLVVFAHGSGSSRKSPRNRFVARTLNEAGLATLLFDLLSREEALADELDLHLRFDIDLLAERLVKVVDWLAARPELARYGLGTFGSSTGAAAALIAAAERPDLVRAVVSRGGRPDLAGRSLPSVRAPSLFIVGGRDREVLALNKDALSRLGGPGRLEVVPGATHLFEEPGALDEVARLAADWFARYLPVARGAVQPIASTTP